jgi:uncharacterized BrkB/YihY/UPF0761 family membrane protein
MVMVLLVWFQVTTYALLIGAEAGRWTDDTWSQHW